MASTYDDLTARYSHMGMRDLIAEYTDLTNSLGFVEQYALQHRFAQLCFFDRNIQNQDRVLAACWARVLQSVLLPELRQDPEKMEAYLADREEWINKTATVGYGSLPFRIATSEDPLGALFPAEDRSKEDNDVQERAHYLRCIVFGRLEDN